MTKIAVSLEAVRARITKAALAAGRPPEAVKLVAVSKTHPPEAIRAAYEAGQRAFGESYARELDEKARALEDLRDLEWHFVGHLQSNKAKLVARVAHAVHTVDSAALARVLGQRLVALGRGPQSPLPVLVEVNIGGEAQKHGVTPGDIDEVLAAIAREPTLRAVGLMTIPPAGGSEVARRIFATLASLRSLHGGEAQLPELSMGMSQDLEEAVGCGATLVRVGTAIFGER